jgi:hypothetical protein
MLHTFEDNEELVTIQVQEEGSVTTTVVPQGAGVQHVDIDELETVIQTVDEPVIFQTTDEISSVFEASPPRGLRGEPGATAGQLLEYPVGHIVSGHRVVVLNSEQKVIYADRTISEHANIVLGITTKAATDGDVTVQVSGELTESSWNWTLGTPIWLNTSGLMTQTPPIAGFSLIIGFPISSTKMFISIREPLFLI